MQYLKKNIRDRILKAATEEFKEHGFIDASIRNIATVAEISLGNIYRYFTNKEALYFAIINPFIDSIKEIVDRDFLFTERTMKEISDDLIDFLMEHHDELLIIRKGNTSHYERFVTYIVEAISGKVKDMIYKAFPEIDEKITNKNMYDIISESFLIALFRSIDKYNSKETNERNCRELVAFFFGNLKQRFGHLERI